MGSFCSKGISLIFLRGGDLDTGAFVRRISVASCTKQKDFYFTSNGQAHLSHRCRFGSDGQRSPAVCPCCKLTLVLHTLIIELRILTTLLPLAIVPSRTRRPPEAQRMMPSAVLFPGFPSTARIPRNDSCCVKV